MDKLFSQRLKRQQKKMQKYLKYVFNDHFNLVLLFLAGALGYYYSETLKTLTPAARPWLVMIGIIWLGLLHLGKLATLMEAADMIYLLPQEKNLAGYLQKALNYSCLLPAAILGFGVVVAMPALVVLNNNQFVQVIWFVLLLWALKFAHLHVQKNQLYQNKYPSYWLWLGLSVLSIFSGLFISPYIGVALALATAGLALWVLPKQNQLLDWQRAIQTEKNRVHQIYRFINLFTDVPEITASVKRRKYLDGLLQTIKPQSQNTYLYLFARRFLRGTEFSGLYLRLTILGGVIVFFLKEVWLAGLIAALFIYLIGFQLLPLYTQFDYLVAPQLYPLPPESKLASLQRLLFILLTLTAFIFTLLLLLGSRNILALAVGGILLAEVIAFIKIYLPARLKKMR